MNLVFDLDGTICFDGHTIVPEIKSLLANAKSYGHEVTFATARSYRDCIALLGETLSKNRVVGLNGGVVYHQANLVTEKTFSNQTYQLITEYCHEHSLPYFADDNFNYTCFLRENIPFIDSVDPLKLATYKSHIELETSIKMVVSLAEHETLLEEIEVLLKSREDCYSSYHKHEKCLYINPSGVSKASTLLESIGQPYIAFGNDKNDIEMFQSAYYSVQVGDYEGLMEFSDKIISKEALVETIKDILETYS